MKNFLNSKHPAPHKLNTKLLQQNNDSKKLSGQQQKLWAKIEGKVYVSV